MEGRPALTRALDAETFRSYYYNKVELVAFCRANGLPVSGGKRELTDRIACFLETGTVVRPAPRRRAGRSAVGPIAEQTPIEPDLVCSERHRAFFREKIGAGFTFRVPFQRWLKANAGKTYGDAIAAYRRLLAEQETQEIDPQFAYNAYVRAFFADNEGRSLAEAIACWKYKKSQRGPARYERRDLAALDQRGRAVPDPTTHEQEGTMGNKPYIICHMMTSVDGRIDCAMTEQLPGVQEYHATLDALAAPTRVSGRVTAELEMALPGAFQSETTTPLGHEAWSRAVAADGYEIVVDTHGTLLWDPAAEERPLLIVTAEQVSREYLAYLDGLGISWIACGRERINLVRACAILAAEFGVARMAVVGGGLINAGFLAAGLLDEVSLLIGAGIDGRGGMGAVFDGLPQERGVTQLRLTDVQRYDSGAVWLRYDVAGR